MNKELFYHEILKNNLASINQLLKFVNHDLPHQSLMTMERALIQWRENLEFLIIESAPEAEALNQDEQPV